MEREAPSGQGQVHPTPGSVRTSRPSCPHEPPGGRQDRPLSCPEHVGSRPLSEPGMGEHLCGKSSQGSLSMQISIPGVWIRGRGRWAPPDWSSAASATCHDCQAVWGMGGAGGAESARSVQAHEGGAVHGAGARALRAPSTHPRGRDLRPSQTLTELSHVAPAQAPAWPRFFASVGKGPFPIWDPRSCCGTPITLALRRPAGRGED